MNNLLLKRKELMEKLKNKDIIASGYMQTITYSMNININLFSIGLQIILFYLLQDVIDIKWNIIICLINLFVSYFVIVVLFLDCFNNNRKIYNISFFGNYLNPLNIYIQKANELIEKIQNEEIKCNKIQYVLYICYRYCLITCTILLELLKSIFYLNDMNKLLYFIFLSICIIFINDLLLKLFVNSFEK